MFFIKMIGAVIALALCPLWGISAQIPEGTALLSPPAGNREEEFHYSSLSVYEEPGQSHSSTLFFNDGFGRLTIFEMEHHDGQMTMVWYDLCRRVRRSLSEIASNKKYLRHITIQAMQLDS